jgi:probable selenium-dependent hydroxylase accessory protein YqeC
MPVNPPSLTSVLGLDCPQDPGGRPQVTAIIGSGGKSTLLWTLAQSLRHKNVLASTTTRMFPPERHMYDKLLDQEVLPPCDCKTSGITFAASVQAGEDTVGAVSPAFLERLFARFEQVFIEADGSRTLPYKGWAVHEPVVPEYTTLTVAVMPVLPEKALANDTFVHRLPIFCDISGAHPDQEILPEHLARLIAHPKGPLKCAKGKVALFFNQAESPQDVEKARTVVNLLPQECRTRFWRIVAGSARDNTAILL